MRVLLTLASSSLTGPAERMLGDAEILRAAGHEATVAFDTRTEGNLAGICRARGIPTASELSLSRHSGPTETARDVVRLRRRLRDGVDLVHAHFSHDHHVALMAATGLPTRVVRSVERQGAGSRLAFARTDGFEAPNKAIARDPRLWGERAAGRVAQLPVAVDVDRFSPAPSMHLREAIGVAADAPLVGIVARMKKDRRHVDLVEAFCDPWLMASGARLAIIGRGEEEGALQALVEARGLSARVKFAGYWGGDDLIAAYRGLDIAVWLAPGNDGGCRGVLEAMSVGLPVVAYDVPPMQEQLAGGAGWLLPNGDAKALARALVALSQNPDARRSMGTLARARVLERYTATQRGPALLAFYEAVLRR